MSFLTTLLVAVLGFLTGSHLVRWLAGGEPTGELTCRKCGHDVRDRAWAASDRQVTPLCRCGARLDVPGAVRIHRRERLKRSLVIAVLLGTIVFSIEFVNVNLFVLDRTWASFLPAKLLAYQLRVRSMADAAEAMNELGRRLTHGEITPETAEIFLEGGLSRHINFWGTESEITRELVQVLAQDRERCAAFIGRTTSLRVDTARADWLPGPPPAGTARIALMTVANDAIPALLTRVEGVAIDGVPCDWSLVHRGGWRANTVGPRVFYESAELVCIPAQPLPASGGILTIDVWFVSPGGAPTYMDVDDPLLNDRSLPPEAWRVNATGFRTTLRVPLMSPYAADAPIVPGGTW